MATHRGGMYVFIYLYISQQEVCRLVEGLVLVTTTAHNEFYSAGWLAGWAVVYLKSINNEQPSA